MPKVSVIVPIYNNELYLEKCLDSIINQTLNDIEIICVNDCSTDGCLEIIKKYALKDKRIKVIDLPQNVGTGKAKNIGIDAASGEYIGFVDSDDFVDENFYERLYLIACDKNLDVVKGNIKTYDNQKGIMEVYPWFNLNYLVKKHKAYFYMAFTTAIYKSEFIRKHDIRFPEKFVYFEDPYFTIKTALFCQSIFVADDIFYFYRYHQESSTRNLTVEHAKCQIKGTDLILELLNKYPQNKEHQVIIYNFLFEQYKMWCDDSRNSDAIIKMITQAMYNLIRTCPFFEEVLEKHFLLKKEIYRKNLANLLREKLRNKNV